MKLFWKNLFLVIIILLVSSGYQYGYAVNDGSRYALESKLNKQGKWVKLKVENNAIYKLTYEKIKEYGVDPSKAKVFGYGGWILDEDFTKPYIDDLPEVACWRSSEELKPGGYLLFYGRGTVKWTYNRSTKEYVHENNSYSTYGVYFLTDAIDGSPKKMQTAESPASASVTLTSFEDYMLHEKEEYSMGKVGRELYGESFSGSNSTRLFSFNIPGILSGNENNASISLSFASDKEKNAKLTLSVNNGNSDQFKQLLDVTPRISSDKYDRGIATDKKITWDADKSENTRVRIEYPNIGYLNYIRLNMIRNLQYYNTPYTFFRSSKNLNADIQYNIRNTNSNLLVFDVTRNQDTKQVATTASNGVLSFSVSRNDTVKEFVLVDTGNSNFPVPQRLNDVTQQNLHGLDQIDMAIISPAAFVSEAERLADKHRTSSRSLNVVVVTPEQIYNEFSSGTPDATAYRRFMKMFYDRGVTTGANLPKYLLLFGDGMFDNRFLDPSCKSFNKENFLLTYQYRSSSLDADLTCPVEDYFGFLDENEEGKDFGVRKIMLGIGRFPIQTLINAKSSVDKQIAYMDNKNYGIWKNSVVLLADNFTTNNDSFVVHLNHTEGIANDFMQKLYSEYMVTKIYLDAYNIEISGGKKTYDNTAKKKLEKSLKDGCLVLNYAGHGGENGFGNNIFTRADIPKMNFKNLPLWITATCDLMWFDGTSSNAGDELFLSKSGAIALFTTSRVVYMNQNERINRQFIQKLFSKPNGIRPSLGDVMRMSKNDADANGSNNEFKYFLAGDPALVLNYPDYEIEIDRINGKSVNDTVFSFKALENVTVSGFIKNGGSIDNSFNGRIEANVFDGIQTRSTVNVNSNGASASFTDYPIRIDQAFGEVKGGFFEFTFPVIMDISDTKNLGKMNLYAYDPISGNEANGSFMNYYIQGTNEEVDLTDTTGPIIKYMYLNDSTFKSGDVVNETPYFVAKVTDKYGINASGAGMGHNIQIELYNNSRGTIHPLNDYYKPSEEEENTGTIAFSIPELEEGEHTLRFVVWNIMNNESLETMNFSVKKGLKPRLFDLTASVNPARIGSKTEFVLNHNRPETPIVVKISVFDLSGRLVWTHEESGISDHTYIVSWDLQAGDIQPGAYIYSATVKSEGGIETTKSKKLIVLDGQ